MTRAPETWITELTPLSFLERSAGVYPAKTAIIHAFARDVLPLFATGAIAPLIHAVYPLEQAADAHRAMEAGSHFGKLVLRVADEKAR